MAGWAGSWRNAPGPEWLHPLYSVTGAPLSTEAIIESLPGYAGSRPVRIGNAADHQVQLDVFGPIAELIHALSESQGSLADDALGPDGADGQCRAGAVA